jgi:CRISPR-associated endonuclease/helicase Cas3
VTAWLRWCEEEITVGDTFTDFVCRATGGFSPYEYQKRLAAEGLPDLLSVPTGSGKTLAAVLPWLWRLRTEPGAGRACLRWLVYVLPMRALVEQTAGEIGDWLSRLGLAREVQFHVLMGGADRDDDAWQLNPGQPAIFAGTQDMVLSRALMRGYAEPRSRWPVSFGLLHAGTQWVFDETQLLGPALGTSAQLQGLREVLGTAAPTATMWMSATLDREALQTPDHRGELTVVEIGEADRTGAVRQRLEATRRISHADLPGDAKAYPQAVAELLAGRHVPNSQTIAVFNTVERAVQAYGALRRLQPRCEVLLIHSRFRPADRQALMARLAGGLSAEGRIVVATQVLEAGLDVTSRTLFTEVARWSSIVQRAGRCNRAGEDSGAELVWGTPPQMSAAPYAKADLDDAARVLADLEGLAMTTEMLQKAEVRQNRPVHAMLRRRDLLQLFDTTPDLAGADLDIGPWIRDGDDSTVFVAWRDFPAGKPAEDCAFPARAELCPAPLHDVRELTGPQSKLRVWAYDRLGARWRFAPREEVIPGAVFLADAAAGGYDPECGWAPQHRAQVPTVAGAASGPDAVGRDDLSYGYSPWVPLAEHLSDVEREARALVAEHNGQLTGLPAPLLEAVALAARFHDLGKAHPVFQETLRGSLAEGDADPGLGPWAKSRRGGGRHRRPYFRHELAGALMLLHPDCPLLSGAAEPDLVAYLVGAHHGKVRVSVRSIAEEAERAPRRVLGIEEGDTVPEIEVPPGIVLPSLRLDLDCLMLGAAGDGSESWASRVLRLRDRPDTGPFRLAYLETLVRVADWRASSAYQEQEQ